MCRRLVYGLLFLLLGIIPAFATDYDLVISDGASTVKNARTIQVYEPGGRLKKGDKIISVLYDTLPAEGIGCTVGIGDSGAVKSELAATGEATGIVGEAQLIAKYPTRTSFKAALIELPPHPQNTDDKLMARKALVEKATSLPWMWIAGGVGLLFVVFMLLRKGSGGSGETAPIFYSGGKGMKEATKEIKDRLDKVEAAQHRLVKDPPVLRRFNAQIAAFDQRLKQIEATMGSIERGLGTLYSSIGAVNGQVSQVMTQQQQAADATRSLSTSLTQISGETSKRFEQISDQVKALSVALDKLSGVPGRVDVLEGQIKSVGQSADAVGARVEAAQKESAAFAERNASALAELRQQVAQVSDKLGELQKLSASVQGFAGQLGSLASRVDAVGVRVETVATQAGAADSKLDLLPGLVTMLNEEIDGKLSGLRQALAGDIEARPVVQQVVEVVRQEPVAEVMVKEALPAEPVEVIPEPVVEEEVAPVEEPEIIEPSALEEPLIEEPAAVLEEPQTEPEVADEQPAAEAGEHSQIDDLVAQIEGEPEAPVIEISGEPAHEDEESEVSAHVGGGRWNAEGGSSQRLWSTEFSRAINFMQSSSHIRPLTPMDTPSIASPIGAMVYANGRVAYSHGDVVRAFWPGKDERVVPLANAMPSDPWRMLVHESQIFCAENGAVEMINTNSWSSQGRFDGQYLNQLHTDKHWAGILNKDGQLAVELRSDAGTLYGQAFELEIDGGEPYLAAASGEHVFVASGSGHVYKVGVEGTSHVLHIEDGRLLQLSVTDAGVLTLARDGDELRARLLSPDGALLREGAFAVPNPYETGVVMGGKLYVVAQDPFEVHTINLKQMRHAGSRPLEGVNRLRRLIGIRHGAHHMLMMAVDDTGNHKGHVSLLSMKSGEELKLCTLNHKHVDLLAADHHVLIATSCSYQNIIQVFEPFTARESLRDVA